MSDAPLRVCYADPPYPGEAWMYRKGDPNAAEVDHAALVAELERDFPDGWALSTKSPALRDVLPLCPPGTRVLAWVKPFASYKPGVGLAYAWEPVLLRGCRKRPRTKPTVRDWVAANITLQKGTPGAKPLPFCLWLFEAMGLEPEDVLVDKYPGSGAVSIAWDVYRRLTSITQLELATMGRAS